MSDWTRSADRKSYTRHAHVWLDDKVYAATFTCTKSPAAVRGRLREGAWGWTMAIVVDGKLSEVRSLASYDTLTEAECSAEWAASRGFHEIAGEWMPRGATRDFPDGLAALPVAAGPEQSADSVWLTGAEDGADQHIPGLSTDEIYRRLVDMGVTPDQAASGVRRCSAQRELLLAARVAELEKTLHELRSDLGHVRRVLTDTREVLARDMGGAWAIESTIELAKHRMGQVDHARGEIQRLRRKP